MHARLATHLRRGARRGALASAPQRGLAMFGGSTDLPSFDLDVHEFPRVMTNTIVNSCPQGHKVVKETFGRYTETHDAGLFVAIPMVHTLRQVDTREITMPVDPQSGTTKDNVRVDIAGVVYLTFTDPVAACYGARRPLYSVMQFAQSAMRAGLGTVELDELFHNRQLLNDYVRAALEQSSKTWGVTVHRYEVTSIVPDKNIARAMDLQAAAERERRQTVKNAEAHKQETVMISEGQRQKDINESEGVRIRLENEAKGTSQKIVLEAEAERQRLVKEAEGEAEATIKSSVAQAEALRNISEALESQNGPSSMKYQMAIKYFEYMSQLGTNASASTIFLPNNVGDMNAMVAQATSIFSSMSKNGAEVPKEVEVEDSTGSTK